MSKTKQHILVADDDHDILAALKLLLSCEGYQVTLASKTQQTITLVKNNSFDLVLLDLNFEHDTTSGEEGLELLKELKQIEPSLPLVVMTGWASVKVAVSAIKNGAADFIEKPWDNERVLSIISTQLKLASQLQQTEKLNQENKLLKASHQSIRIINRSTAMQKVLQQVQQIAQSDVPIVITGENGTGKSLLAEKIHQGSHRHQHSLINVNMGAIPETLFESEMFGHVKGAFTDAKEQRIGRFELADKGSLFLDEIGNIPLSQQAKLLRVLESQQFEKVGTSKTQSVDIRIIAATNANINQLIQEGEFRQDLFYRLNGIEIQLPPLRQRTDDIMLLAESFLDKYTVKYQKPELTFASSAQSALLTYAWPGNIRELNHMVERAVILCDKTQINIEMLAIVSNTTAHNETAQIHADQTNATSSDHNAALTLEELEQSIIRQRIAYHQGNMQNAAKSLGLSRSAFYRRIDKYKL